MKLVNASKVLGTALVLGQMVAGPIVSHADTKPVSIQTQQKSGIGIESKAEIKTGWQYIDGLAFYYENGKPVTGWKTFDGVTCYFNQTGDDSGMNREGQMAKGFTKIYGKLYYFNQTGDGSGMGHEGEMAKGFKTIYNKLYHFNEDGTTSTDITLMYDGKLYTFGADGVGTPAKTGFVNENGGTYYYPDGHKPVQSYLGRGHWAPPAPGVVEWGKPITTPDAYKIGGDLVILVHPGGTVEKISEKDLP